MKQKLDASHIHYILVKLPGMNICIIGPKKSKATLKIKLAAERRNHVCKRIQLIDVYFELKDNKVIVNHRKFNLQEFDVFLFRTINPAEKEEAITLAKHLKEMGKIVIDECLEEVCLNDYETLVNLAKANIPMLNIIRTSGLKAARDILMEFPHPILIKPLEEDKERYIVSEDWTDSYDIVRTEKTKRFEFQELVQADYFVKVFVIGNKIVGAIKKNILENDLRLNFAAKTRSEKFEADEALKGFALKVTDTLKYEIASVDFVMKNNTPVLIAADRSPKFKIFDKFAEKKFAESVIDYIESKVA